MGSEQRKYMRVQFKEPVSFNLREPQRHGGCLAYDLSENGMRINFDQFVPLHSEMTVQVKFGRSAEVINMAGRVVWVQKIPHSERYQIGLQFDDTGTSSQSRERIHERIKISQN